MPKKNKSRTGSALPTFVQLLSMARSEDDPEKMVRDISRLLGVPDVCTARGLKECHHAFATVSSKLDELYLQTRQDRWDRASADRLAAFIIFTCGRIAEDQVLRNRIFSETQFLERAAALFSSPHFFAGKIVIKTLSDITAHNDHAILRKIMHIAPTILDYAEANGAQIGVECMEEVVFILVYSTLPVYANANPDPELVTLAPITRILDFSLANLTSKSLKYLTFFCFMTTTRFPTVFLAKFNLINFLVAATRAQDFQTRCFAQFSLIGIYSGTAWRELKPGKFQPERFQQLHGSTSIYAQSVQGMVELSSLVQNFDKNSSQSHSRLGHALSDFMQGNPRMVRGFLELPATGLDLSTILESCAAALRRDGSTRAMVAADILHVELLLWRDKAKAYTFARSCIERHPSVAYFYYAVTALPDTIVPPGSATYFAEKGLRCRPISDFIRRELLGWVAVFSHETVTAMLCGGGRLNVEHIRKILILVEQGLLHASSFLEMTPLDDPRAAEMSAISSLFNLMCTGDLLTPTELATMQARFSSACKTARDDIAFRLTKEWSALELIFDRMPAAWECWGSIVSRTEEPTEGPRHRKETHLEFRVSTADPNGDQFLSWLQELHKATPEGIESEIRGVDDPVFCSRYGEAGLHRCSACNAPNAALKHCSGCQRARYCNNTCQKSHWKVHRDACQAK
ncbi:hypothetical protein FB45DRAFT_397026 [Roridomyces roridus]|uniref:MYND-type domain-containing protein n=1 Tax=Roridomyces roridus TaxID=1738132 RepID=A0AAD7C596_9AGAR|nr:hypothetical protein FB45DRAFT_397026 [Roridomyces roridus]